MHDKGADWRGLAHTPAHHRSHLSDKTVRVDGTYATALSSDTLQDELQRKLGLWLSAALPTLRVALERGMPVDFFGDYLYNKAHHRRPHDGVLAAWADAMRAPANAPVVHGDKEKPELTRQYQRGVQD